MKTPLLQKKDIAKNNIQNQAKSSNQIKNHPFPGNNQNPFVAADQVQTNLFPTTQMKINPLQKQGMEEEEEMLQAKTNPLQKQEMEEEEEMLQAKTNPLQKQEMEEEEEMLQAKTNPLQKKEGDNSVNISHSGGNSLPGDIQEKMEQGIGADFSSVKIHPNSSSAEQVGALAYTQGDDIHFAPGQYSPENPSGQELLGHELAHVVQQRNGQVSATTQTKGVPVNDDPGLEQEADDIGRKVSQMKMPASIQKKKS